jgi:hypothetical protein
MSHGNRNRRLRRLGDLRHAQGGFAPRGFAGAAHEPEHSWEHHSEEYFGRAPFTYGREPRYYGTGVPGYISGPGYTGGYFGYGDEPPEIPTELERAYAYDVYGYGPGTYEPPYRAGSRRPPESGYFPRERKYPPGPKGYVRSDERIREDLCDRIAAALHVDSSDVTVDVAGGKVVLEGTVPDRRMKHVIEDMADACPGVHDVDNRIRVQATSSGGSEAAA